MLFNSYVFIFIFLPLVFAVYFGLNHYRLHRAASVSLVVASLVFYAWFNPSYLWIITVSVMANYTGACMIERSEGVYKRRIWLILAIAFNIALLGYFKYYDFFISNINRLLGTQLILTNVLLPLGISFFTFQQLAFVIDTYRRDCRVPDFVTYCNFVTFFPQLIAGPIVLPNEMIPQFADPQRRSINYSNIYDGLYIFTIGLAKKVIIADSVGAIANIGFYSFNANLSSAEAWLVAISFAVQIYFDFSGYCDMAVGVGRMFNIHLPFNFNKPYLATSIRDFWQRWHITLTRFLTKYVYIPLGGSRKGEGRTAANTMTVFLVSGIWHGAAWAFILWGLLHGIGVAFNRLWSRVGIVLPKVLSVTATFLCVTVLWVIFRRGSIRDAHAILSSMFSFSDFSISKQFVERLDSHFSFVASLVILLVALVLCFAGRTSQSLMQDRKSDIRKKSVAITVLLVASILMLSRDGIFIYFNF